MDVFPKGLYIEDAMQFARQELTLECDYEHEAENQEKYRALIGDSKFFYVPGTRCCKRCSFLLFACSVANTKTLCVLAPLPSAYMDAATLHLAMF